VIVQETRRLVTAASVVGVAERAIKTWYWGIAPTVVGIGHPFVIAVYAA
jgi:hypothetical protein